MFWNYIQFIFLSWWRRYHRYQNHSIRLNLYTHQSVSTKFIFDQLNIIVEFSSEIFEYHSAHLHRFNSSWYSIHTIYFNTKPDQTKVFFHFFLNSLSLLLTFIRTRRFWKVFRINFTWSVGLTGGWFDIFQVDGAEKSHEEKLTIQLFH